MTIDPATDNIIDDDPLAAVASFVERLACCCAAVDYDGGASRCSLPTSRHSERRRQWSPVSIPSSEISGSASGRISRGLESSSRASTAAAMGRIAWGMVPWTSVGFSEDGARFERRGRATVVLERRGPPLARCAHPFLVGARYPAGQPRRPRPNRLTGPPGVRPSAFGHHSCRVHLRGVLESPSGALNMLPSKVRRAAPDDGRASVDRLLRWPSSPPGTPSPAGFGLRIRWGFLDCPVTRAR